MPGISMSSSELLTRGLREGEGTQLMNSKRAFFFWRWGVCWKNRKGDRAGEWRWCLIVVVFKESFLRGHQGKSVLGMEPNLVDGSMWGTAQTVSRGEGVPLTRSLLGSYAETSSSLGVAQRQTSCHPLLLSWKGRDAPGMWGVRHRVLLKQ